MSALEDAVASLNQAIQEANSRFQVAGDVEAAVAAERQKYDELVAAEAEEDLLQNQELQDARAKTDAAVSELNSAAESIQAAADQVNTLGQVASEQPNSDDTSEPSTETAPSAATGDTTAEVSPTTDTTPSENPTDAAPADVPTAGDVMRSDDQAQESDPTSTKNMEPNV